VAASPELLELLHGADTIQSRKRDFEAVIERLHPIIETGNAELRLLSIVPPFSLLIIDVGKPDGKVQVSPYSYRIDSSDRPHFVLRNSTDKHWYDFFVEQFDKLWIDAKAVKQQQKERGTL